MHFYLLGVLSIEVINVKSKEQLWEDYEDALFAILMSKIAEFEGERLYEENERLKRNPAAEVPPEFDRKSREAILRACQGQHGQQRSR